MAASPSLFSATFLVDQAPTRKARSARSRTSTDLLIERAGDRRLRPAALRSPGSGEYATRQDRRPSLRRAHRRGVVVRGQFPTPRPPRQGTARAACPVRHRRPRRTRRYLSLLALLTQSALRPVPHSSGQAAQINGQRLPGCPRRRRLDEAIRLGRLHATHSSRSRAPLRELKSSGRHSTCRGRQVRVNRAGTSTEQTLASAPRGRERRVRDGTAVPGHRGPRGFNGLPGYDYRITASARLQPWRGASWPPGEPGRRELWMCRDGHHHDNEQYVPGSEGCEAGTSHPGVTLPTSSLCF
jgi:hypothetical protein